MLTVSPLMLMPAVSSGITITRRTWEAKPAGEALSATRNVMRFVPENAADGVQEKAPLDGSMAAPAGAPESRVKVSICAGRSGSEAVALKLRRVWAGTVQSLWNEMDGGEFTSLTVTVNGLDPLRGGAPSSVATTVI